METPLRQTRQPWKKIIKAEVTHTPWEDVYSIMHTKTTTKAWDSFCDFVIFQLQQVFQYNTGETLN